jgi:putative hydroxymethylpyrimidine transport system substrate-binding protein
MRVFGGAIKGSQALAFLLAIAVSAGCGGGNGTDAAQVSAPEATGASSGAVVAGKRCPETPDRNLWVGLEDFETPEAAGILMAKKRGYFADSGLRVSLVPTPVPEYVIPDLTGGIESISLSHEPEAVLARDRGKPIVIVGSLVSKPTAALIWLKSAQIGGIADLKGKTIGVPGLPFQKRFLEKALASGGLTLADVKVESLGARSNLQGAELEARGLEPVVTPVQDLGIPAYDETVLIAEAACVSKKPEIFRKFLAAVARGTAAAVEDPEAALEALEAASQRNPETGREAMKAQVEATLPLLSRTGQVDPARARALVDWMHEEGMIQREVPVSELFANAHLPTSQSP